MHYNVGGVGPTDDGGWSQPVVRTRQPYSVETAKLKNKPVSIYITKTSIIVTKDL